MTFLKVLLAILLVLWFISLIRVGGRVRYGKAGLFITALAGPVKIQLFPFKPKKEEKPKKESKKKESKKKQEKKLKRKSKNVPKKEEAPKKKKPAPEGQPGTLPRLMKLLPVAAQFCGSLKRKIRIDDLELELIWGGSDPAAIALGYGQANAVLGMLWPIFDHNFKVKHHSFQIGMDYGAAQPTVELQAAVTLTVGQGVALAVRYGVKALVTWIKSGRPAVKRQEALSHE